MAYALKDACNTFIYERTTGKPFLYADYLNSASLSIEGDTVFAKAKGMNKIAFEGSKSATFTMETEIFEFKYLALLLGGRMTKGTSDISKRHVATIGADLSVTLPGKALANSICAFKVDKDGKTHKSEISQTPTISVSGSDTKLVWTTGVAEGDLIAVYYLVRMNNATKINISDRINNESFKIVGITSIKDEFSVESLFQFELHNAKTQVNCELTLSAENVSSFSAKFDVLLDEKNDFIDFTLLNDEEVTPAQVKALEAELTKNK